MNLTLITSLVSAAIGFGVAWQLQGHQILKLELGHTNERIAIERQARTTIERLSQQRDQAQASATARAIDLRHSADGARAELDGLQHATENTVRTASTNADACLERTAATAGLLNQCAREYQTLAERADRHVSDIKTLTDSWPK